MRIEIEVNGRAHDVVVEPAPSRPGRFRVSWEGTTREVDASVVERDRHGVVLSLVRVDGGAASRQVQCRATGRKEVTAVHLDGVVIDAVINGTRTQMGAVVESGAAAGASRLTAPMPGKVVRVLVAPGDAVEARQPLVVVEAMKMENELAAPRAGIVTEVPVTEGMSVEAGRLLAAIE